METVYDALGNPIIMGELYGASRNANGHTTITVGRAVNVTPKLSVSLEVVKHLRALYNDKPEVRTLQSKKVTYLPSGLFPVDETKIR